MVELSEYAKIQFPKGGHEGELVDLRRLRKVMPILEILANLPTNLGVSVLDTSKYKRAIEVTPESFGNYNGKLPEYGYRVRDWYHEHLNDGKNCLSVERWYDEELNEICKRTQINFGETIEERSGKITVITDGEFG